MVPGRNVGRVRTEISMVLTVVLVLKKKKTKKKICSTEVYKGRRNFDYVRQNSGTDNISSLDVVRWWLTIYPYFWRGEKEHSVLVWTRLPKENEENGRKFLNSDSRAKTFKKLFWTSVFFLSYFFSFSKFESQKRICNPSCNTATDIIFKKKKIQRKVWFLSWSSQEIIGKIKFLAQ